MAAARSRGGVDTSSLDAIPGLMTLGVGYVPKFTLAWHRLQWHATSISGMSRALAFTECIFLGKFHTITSHIFGQITAKI